MTETPQPSPSFFSLWSGREAGRPTIILTHGAGAGAESPFMNRISDLLVGEGFAVCRIEFAYMAKRRTGGKKRPPPRADKLVPELKAMVESILAETDGPVLLGGKSMGGRVAAMLAGEALDARIRGVACLGYPFHPTGQSEKTRLEPLQQSILPVLVCQGERDAFGWWDEVVAYELPDHVQVHWVTDGSHDFGPTGKSPATLKDNMRAAAKAVRAWFES